MGSVKGASVACVAGGSSKSGDLVGGRGTSKDVTAGGFCTGRRPLAPAAWLRSEASTGGA